MKLNQQSELNGREQWRGSEEERGSGKQRGETECNEIKSIQESKHGMAGWSQAMCKIGKRIAL